MSSHQEINSLLEQKSFEIRNTFLLGVLELVQKLNPNIVEAADVCMDEGKRNIFLLNYHTVVACWQDFWIYEAFVVFSLRVGVAEPIICVSVSVHNDHALLDTYLGST